MEIMSAISSNMVNDKLEAHKKNVLNYIEQEGLSHCKKRQKKLLGMSPHAFAVLKLNALIAKYCKLMDI